MTYVLFKQKVKNDQNRQSLKSASFQTWNIVGHFCFRKNEEIFFELFTFETKKTMNSSKLMNRYRVEFSKPLLLNELLLEISPTVHLSRIIKLILICPASIYIELHK